MKSKPEIEAALERSLRRQVSAPALDSRFDAAVWSRIEAEEPRRAAATAQAPAETPRTARWLYFVNLVGIASATICICLYGLQMLIGLDVALVLSDISAMGVTIVALLFGLMYTPWGRRLRDELI